MEIRGVSFPSIRLANDIDDVTDDGMNDIAVHYFGRRGFLADHSGSRGYQDPQTKGEHDHRAAIGGYISA